MYGVYAAEGNFSVLVLPQIGSWERIGWSWFYSWLAITFYSYGGQLILAMSNTYSTQI